MTFLALVLSQTAQAANCDSYRKKAESATGKNLVQTYNQLIDCDKSLAEDSFVDFMKRTNEIPTLAKLSLAAIDKQGKVSLTGGMKPGGMLYLYIKNGFGRMPAYGHAMSDNEIWQVVHYIESLNGQQF